MSPKLHAHAGIVAGAPMGLCGWQAVLTTTEATAVTCESCRKKLRHMHDDKLRAMGIDYLERTVTIQEQGPDGRIKLRNVKRRTMAKEGIEGILDKLAGDWEGKHKGPRMETRWAGIGHALAEMVRADLDGPLGTSMSDPDRMERLSGRLGGLTPSSTSREESEAQDLHTVRRAWRLAFVGWDPTPLTMHEARTATVLRYVGKVTEKSGIQTKSPTEIAEMLGEGVTPKAVGRATRQAGQRVYEYLRERELVPARRPYTTAREQDDMALGGYDYVGWKAIAEALEVSEATAKRWRDRTDHPLPVHPIGGNVRARGTELEAWLEEEADRNRRAS